MKKEKSPLVNYAEKWLRNRGLFDKDSDYKGMLGEAVLRMINTFSQEGHSGASAYRSRELFNKLLDDYENGKSADYRPEN